MMTRTASLGRWECDWPLWEGLGADRSYLALSHAGGQCCVVGEVQLAGHTVGKGIIT